MLPLTRRAALGGLATLGVAAAVPRVALAQASGPFKLDPMPYANDALEPHIDAKTMELHHGKHHAAYVENLNKALQEHGQLAQRPLHELLQKLQDVPESIRTTVRNNGGGHANHTMFWQIMGPPGRSQANVGTAGQGGVGAPSGELAQAIERDFGGLEKFKADFNAAGGRHFGSGWVFVTVSREGKLALETMPNQDTPLIEGRPPLLGNDLWEHAFYLKYQNRKADYLKAWWNIVNWQKVGERYAAAKSGKLAI
ncbi:MAG TPA: Fe-Mn family superoxide dismutase [Xanthobacteraceae bacterium]|nr:Fe-Mn family superoxide dismutase [Xanthobacteraceae bacterium]